MRYRHILFDWGNTLMRNIPSENGPMYKWKRVELIPKVKDMLQYLYGKYNLHIATNASDSTEEEIKSCLKRVDIDRFFDEVFCYRTTGFKKPDAKFFNYILKKLKAKRDDCLMIGDSLTEDVEGAIESGLSSIYYTDGADKKIEEKRYQTIVSMNELLKIL